MKWLDRIFYTWLEEKNERPESGMVAEALRQYKVTAKSVAKGEPQELWDAVCLYADAREEEGFKAGFSMACDILTEFREIPKMFEEMKQIENTSPKIKAKENWQGKATVRFDCSQYGKKLIFNTLAADLLGEAKRANLFVSKGDLVIIPCDNGSHAIVRTDGTKAASISCSQVFDELGMNSGKYNADAYNGYLVVHVSAGEVPVMGRGRKSMQRF